MVWILLDIAERKDELRGNIDDKNPADYAETRAKFAGFSGGGVKT